MVCIAINFANFLSEIDSFICCLLYTSSEEEQIHEIKYLPTELVPQLEGGKNTIVDEMCIRDRLYRVPYPRIQTVVLRTHIGHQEDVYKRQTSV